MTDAFRDLVILIIAIVSWYNLMLTFDLWWNRDERKKKSL